MAKRKLTVDIEAQAQEAKAKREQACAAEINKVLSDCRCGYLILVQVGDITVPFDQIIKLPVVLRVTVR